MHFKDWDRVTLSIILGIVLHVAVFFLVQLLIRTIPRIPEYSGPLFVEITDQMVRDIKEPVEETFVDTPVEETETRPQEETSPAEITETRPQERITETRPQERITDTSPAENIPDSGDPGVVPVDPDNNQAENRVPEDPGDTGDTTDLAQEENTEQVEESALGDMLANLDQALNTDSTPSPTKSSTATASPAQGSHSSGGTTPLIEWLVQAEPRTLERQVMPDLSSISLKDVPDSTVKLEFYVQASGFLTKISIKESCGYTEADLIVLGALRNWKFNKIQGSQQARAVITFVIKTM